MNLRLLAVVIFFLGVGLLGYAFTLPYYSNQTAVDDAEAKYIIKAFGNKLTAEDEQAAKKTYHDAEEKYRTAKRSLLDAGSGLAISGLVFLLFLFIKKAENTADVKNLQSFTKIKIFIYANIAGLLSFPGTVWYYTYRQMRGDFPAFADSIAIPIMYQSTGQIAVIAALNIFLVLTLWKAQLPTRVFVKAQTYSLRPILWEVFFALALLLSLFSVISAISDGDHVAVLTSMFFTWIFLNLRAGRIGKYAV